MVQLWSSIRHILVQFYYIELLAHHLKRKAQRLNNEGIDLREAQGLIVGVFLALHALAHRRKIEMSLLISALPEVRPPAN